MTPLLHVGKDFALSFREGIFHKLSKHVMDMLSHFETIQHLRAEYLWCPPICMVKMGRKELNKKPNHGRFFKDVSFFISVYVLSLPVFSFAKVRHHTTFCNQKTCNKLPKKNITSVYLRSFFWTKKSAEIPVVQTSLTTAGETLLAPIKFPPVYPKAKLPPRPLWAVAV